MNSSAVLAFIALCLALGALVVVVTALQVMRSSRVRCAALEVGVAALRRDLELVAASSARTGRRVQRVAHEYSDVADRVDVVESRSPATAGAGSLDQAIEWARRGADSDQLAQQFGLSSGEAELVARMHGHKLRA